MRKIISLFLTLFLTFAFAQSSFAVYDPNAKQSKWYVDRLMADPTLKSSVEIKAQRNYPVSTLGADGKPILQNKIQKSTIKLAPKASSVGKSLLKRTPVGVITQALIGLGISATDWVLDPENNRVKYKDPNNPTGGSGGDYYFVVDGAVYDQHDKACQAVYDKDYPNQDPKKYMAVNWVGNHNDICRFLNLANGTYTTYNGYSVRRLQNPFVPGDPADAGYQYIPIDQIANKVIEQAGAGDPAAMEVMSDTALDMLEAGLLNDQLAAAADPKVFNEGETDPTDPNSPSYDPELDPDNPTKPETQPFEFPPFCDWATKVCDFIDWVQTEPSEPEESGDIEVQKPDPVIHEDLLERLYINMPAQCPPDPVLEFMGARIPFPMSVFCQFAVMMKPLILLFAYIKGLAIIGNGLS